MGSRPDLEDFEDLEIKNPKCFLITIGIGIFTEISFFIALYMNII